jgi:hypothetical protein
MNYILLPNVKKHNYLIVMDDPSWLWMVQIIITIIIITLWAIIIRSAAC